MYGFGGLHMKLEVLNITPEEQRILLVFNEEESEQREKIDTYLKSHDLEPKRQYKETRNDEEHLIYFFGQCYLEGHMDHLASMAVDSNLDDLRPHIHK
jgi:hypothetical protein